RTDTDEQSLYTLKSNCLIPVLHFLPNGIYVFVVMPRWGFSIHLPWISKAREVFEIMHSMLKALVFLRDHNISTHGSTSTFHRLLPELRSFWQDINDRNVLVNHFSDSIALDKNWIRVNLRSKGMLSYAVFDFDFSVMLSPEADRKVYRLPYQRSWGAFNYTMDTAQSEFDYNPFVLDVGILGVRFCLDYQLAPLLDKMTTRDLDHRFTAPDVLDFFNESYVFAATEEELECYAQTQFREPHVRYYDYNRWKHVSGEFAQKWIVFREAPIPWTTKFLRTICKGPWMCYAVP
ncbi:hypothetical protein CPB84DRAFT_1943115, partial [Gymnopilus junonius]